MDFDGNIFFKRRCTKFEHKKMKDNAVKTHFEALFAELDEIFMNAGGNVIYKTIIEAVERPVIEKALERTFGNQLKAAKILGMHRNTLRAKISKLGIHPEKWKI